MTRRSLLALVVGALLAALLLAGVHALTRERIATHSTQRAALALVLPASMHDNDPLAEEVHVHAPRWLGSELPLRAWRARRGGAASALVLETVATDGYAGPIRLLIGVDTAGTLLGVRVTDHRETAGLGDWIDARMSDWIDRFAGRSLADPPRERWAVKRDGGDFDQFAGATVTPRAVVKAVRRTLDYVARHRAEIEAAPTGSTLEHRDAPID